MFVGRFRPVGRGLWIPGLLYPSIFLSKSFLPSNLWSSDRSYKCFVDSYFVNFKCSLYILFCRIVKSSRSHLRQRHWFLPVSHHLVFLHCDESPSTPPP